MGSIVPVWKVTYIEKGRVKIKYIVEDSFESLYSVYLLSWVDRSIISVTLT